MSALPFRFDATANLFWSRNSSSQEEARIRFARYLALNTPGTNVVDFERELWIRRHRCNFNFAA